MIRKEVLEEVIKNQRKRIMNLDKGIPREILPKIKPNKEIALVITGIRRCGKSTLLRQILSQEKEFYFLNLEDPRLENFELKDFHKVEDIFKKYSKNGTYFFDEIQNVDKWEKYIRLLVDKKKKVVITGSNASLLSKELGSRLTGRHKQIELTPFSYSEYLKFTQKKKSVQSSSEFLFDGGFPIYLKLKDTEILNELLKDVLMRDIAIRYNIRNTKLLQRLAIFLLNHVGNEFSYNSIKKMLNVKSTQTVIDYFSFFEDAYLIFTLPKFDYSYKKQQINPKKIYTIDTGIANANTIRFSERKGEILENAVFLSLKRKYKELFYFQDEESECDFLVKEKDKITRAIQVTYKLEEHNELRELKGLMNALIKFNLKEGIIITQNQEDIIEKENKKIKVIPAKKFL